MEASATQNPTVESDPADRDRQREVHRIVDEVMMRRDAGDYLPDERVIDAHRDLMPELGEELAVLRDIHLAALAARKAGPSISSPALSGERLSQPITDASIGDAEADSGELRRPVIVGYTVLEGISHGGQASVYTAIQDCTGRKVALKVMHGGRCADSRSRLRFEQETRILAQLSHPHIVSVLDAGRTSDGSFYLAMSFVEGGSLDDYFELQKGRPSETWRETVSLFADIADAIGEAHRHGIVHRDLKPSNIRVDLRGKPCVLDFGLAQILEPDGLGRIQPVTLTGQMVGSVPWFSPEQANGLKLDQRSDVYALGVMIYKTFTGQFPYPVVGAVRDVLNHIVSTSPPPMSDVMVAYEGPADIQRIVERALAKISEARYPSAAELAADLRQLLTTPTPSPASAPAIKVRPRTWTRHKLRYACIAVCVTGLAAFAIESQSKLRHGVDPSKTIAAASVPVPIPAEAKLFTNSAGIVLRQFPSGTFMMGSPPDEPGHQDDEMQHPVTLSRPFWMALRLTTIRQYKTVMGTAPDHAGSQNDDPPAAPLTWSQAANFCAVLSQREHRTYRLPTEAEWEYACRLGTQPKTGQRAGNLMGLPAGIGEWCLDWYRPYLPEPAIDPRGTEESYQRVVRGETSQGEGKTFRPAHRSSRGPDMLWPTTGFRIVLESASHASSSDPP